MSGVAAATIVGANAVGGYLQGEAAKEASKTQAASQLEAARIAAEEAKFRPVGVSGYYGSSNFTIDPKTGRLTGAGYSLSPEALAQQQRLAGMANQGLDQYEQMFGTSKQWGQAGQGMFNLGSQYLATSPQEQAAKYMQEQQALLSGSRETRLADIRNDLMQKGRYGLAVGGTSQGDAATNPELAAYYNAIAQQDRELAAQATQGGMDYAKFGQGMITAGAGAFDQMYGMQTGAFNPYQVAQGGVGALEAQGQGMLNMGAELGGRSATAGATQAQILNTGGQNAANSMFNANAYSPWANVASGIGQGAMAYANYNKPAAGANVDPAYTSYMYNTRPMSGSYTPYAASYSGS